MTLSGNGFDRRMRVLGLTLGILGCPAFGGGVNAAVPLVPAPQIADSAFRHDRHTSVACQECHTMQSGHGALRVRTISDCRSCHHTRARVNRDCAACHQADELRNAVLPQARVMTLSVRDGPEDRELLFSHSPHEGRACVECHSGGPSLAPSSLDCNACHKEHHVETVAGCTSCHRQPAEAAHTPRVHQTCSGSGCHADPPIEVPPRTRVGCLWCHEDRADHEPRGRCVDCHFLPR